SQESSMPGTRRMPRRVAAALASAIPLTVSWSVSDSTVTLAAAASASSSSGVRCPSLCRVCEWRSITRSTSHNGRALQSAHPPYRLSKAGRRRIGRRLLDGPEDRGLTLLRMQHVLQISRKIDYALRAMIHLAGLPDGRIAPLQDLASTLHLPREFLAKILKVLVSRGGVRSVRGAHGASRWAGQEMEARAESGATQAKPSCSSESSTARAGGGTRSRNACSRKCLPPADAYSWK